MSKANLLSWTGLVRFHDKDAFRIGNVYTEGFRPHEARQKLEALADKILPQGWTLGWYGRGKLIYQEETDN